MKALLLTDNKQLEVVEDFPQPDCSAEEVLVAVRACGICGSDIHGFDGSSGRRIPPLVMGHEASGEIVEVGANVSGWEVGTRVAFDSMVSCGRCHFCRRGETNLCDNRRVLGVSCGDYRKHGAFAELVAVPAACCYRLPDNLSFEHAALIEPVSIAVHATSRLPIALGDTAVVVGSGMIGLLVIQCLKLAGCPRVIAVDLDDHRLAVARKLGADEVINSGECDPVERIRELTHGRGADVTAEVVGIAATVAVAVESTRKGGAVALVGNLTAEIPLGLQSVVTREISLLGMCGSQSAEYPICIDLLSQRKIQVEPLITGRGTLEDGPSWFDRLYAAEAGAMKVILQPGRA